MSPTNQDRKGKNKPTKLKSRKQLAEVEKKEGQYAPSMKRGRGKKDQDLQRRGKEDREKT